MTMHTVANWDEFNRYCNEHGLKGLGCGPAPEESQVIGLACPPDFSELPTKILILDRTFHHTEQEIKNEAAIQKCAAELVGLIIAGDPDAESKEEGYFIRVKADGWTIKKIGLSIEDVAAPAEAAA
jgi:hypothetical protein